MMDALNAKKRLEEMDAAMEKRAAEEADRKAAAEAEEKAKAEAWKKNAPVFVGPSAEPITGEVEPIAPEITPEETGEVFDFRFAVRNVTQTQIGALVEFLENGGFDYEMEL